MTDAELQALLDAASPGPWHHVNPGMLSPKTRTIHGTVPAEPVDYVSTWPGLGTPPGHRVVIPRDAGVRSDDIALIAEAPTLAAEVLTLRAGAAASADRIKRLRRALINTGANLLAAISLLENGGKKAAPSDKMFKIMLSDYRAAADRAAALLKETGND